jgi:hypothetical protein
VSVRPERWGPVVGAAIGVPVMAFGAWGLVADGDRTHPAEAARWVVGAAVVHDALWLPALLVVGGLLSRAVPSPARGPVMAALGASAVVVAVAWPFAARYGADPTNPSLLVRDAAAGAAAYVAAVWVVALAVVARRLWRSSAYSRGRGSRR